MISSPLLLTYPTWFFSAISCHFLPFVLSLSLSRWAPPYPWHSFTLVFGSIFTSTISSPPPPPPLCCYSVFFLSASQASGPRAKWDLEAKARVLFPPSQIGVSYCRLHAGINHLLPSTSYPAARWKEGGKIHSLSYFLPISIVFPRIFCLGFFLSALLLSAFRPWRQDVRGVWLTNSEKNFRQISIFSPHLRTRCVHHIMCTEKPFHFSILLLNSSTKYEM